MKKLTTFSALLFLFFTLNTIKTAAQSFVDQHGQLSTKGINIVDKNGQPLQLNGMSFFWSQWMGKYYTYDVVKWLRDDWHCSAIRAAMGVEMGGYLEHPDVEKQKVFTLIDAAIDLGIYVIVDWHDHKAQAHTQEAKMFFAELAQKYGNKPNLLYEIYNEPVKVGWSDVIKPYSLAVIDTIRLYDPDNIIICGTPTWSQDVDDAAEDSISRTNIAYTLHYYAATHKQNLREKAEVALKKNMALFVTEYGTCEASGNGTLDYAESKKWWDFLDEYKIGYLNWSVADKVETASALMPNASEKGGWNENMLTPSGKFVRAKLREESLDTFFKLQK